MLTQATAVDWAVFAVVVLAALIVDGLLFARGKDEISFREATLRSIYSASVGVLFAGWVYLRLGSAHSVDYFTAYLVEESLSVDNLFVFLVIFNHFRTGPAQQQRVLRWGVAGAVVMRGLFVAAGSVLLHHFQWTAYVFGGFLVFTGARLALHKGEAAVDPEAAPSVRLARHYLSTTRYFDGDRFFTLENGIRRATPLLVVLVVIELTDVVFAVDSVPAVLAISNHAYIVYTSNIFAILGLRALYFMVAGMMDRFKYLEIGLSVILIFVGVKMAIARFVHIPSLASLGVIALVLTVAVVASLLRGDRRDNSHDDDSGA